MAITRYNRGSDFDLLRREMSRLFDDFVPARTADNQESSVWAPRADLSETDDAYVIAIDLPGVSRDDLEITVEDGTLKVSGERSMKEEAQTGQFYRIERAYGRFFRSFNFGSNVDPDSIEAHFDDGVLTIRAGKAEERKPRRIEVGSRNELEPA
jgi:HSP20 family protein